MESHNHPSYIEPYQGAATGVGGILRDIFTMGARPIACLDALSFGAPSHPRTRHLVSGVVAGIGGYGNSFGVPTVGGSVRLPHPLRRQLPGQCDGRRASRGPTRFSTPPPRASACRSSISAPRPAATASTAPPWPRPNSARIPRKSARPCRSAIRSRKSCCSRPASRSWRRTRHRHPGYGRGGAHLLGGRDGRAKGISASRSISTRYRAARPA